MFRRLRHSIEKNHLMITTNGELANLRIYSLVVDYDAMISIESEKYGGICNVKPLRVIWDRYAEFYNPTNTIMFDDLSRNFLMNPQNVRQKYSLNFDLPLSF